MAGEVAPLLDWRIIAAAAAALTVLAGGTLLAAQVETDLDAGIEQRQTDARFGSAPDVAPLKLNEFKLPKDVPFQIPPGTEVSPDLSKLTLPEDMDLQLPDDLDLSNLDFKLPEDLTLELPEGTKFSPPGLDLPKGATIKLPDGREFKIPSGSGLSLPPDVVQRLLDQGLPAGTLLKPGSFDMRGLPSDLHATLDPPQFQGGGSLHLPGGTTITLPDGTRVPFPPGILPYAARYLLPAGTSFDIPFDTESSQGGTFPVPQPGPNAQLVDAEKRAPTKWIAVDTEITNMPSRVRKGDSIVVSGYVREIATSRGVAGAPVDVFMNESKERSGVLVGQGFTDGSGIFSIRLTLPADKPASNYQLVNHAASFTDASGRAFSDGWGDPPFATFATTEITLELPARDGLGVSTSFGGTLLDHTRTPVPSASIVVWIDNVIVARPTTNANGRYTLAYTFPAGAHRVEARFAGNPNYDASQTASGSIVIDDFAIEVPPVLWSKPGEGLTLSGRVLGRGAVAPDRLVSISIPFRSDPVVMTSDPAGRFSYSFATPATTSAGRYPILYSLPEQNVTESQALELNQSGRISLSMPNSWDLELPIPLAVSLQTAQGVPISNQGLRFTLDGPGGVRDIIETTNSQGAVLRDISPLRSTPGSYIVTVRAIGSPYLEVAPVTNVVTLGLFEVDWVAPTDVVRGQPMTGHATILFGGKPFARQTVTLDVFGPSQTVTDAAGVARWTKTVPTTAALGNVDLTLQALDHPMRTRLVEVVAIPKLTLTTPPTFVPGEPIKTSLTLVDDQGAPIGASKIRLSAGKVLQEVTTDPRGQWRGDFDPKDLSGNVSLSARFEERGSYLGAQSQSVLTASTRTSPLGGMAPWLLPLVGLALAGGAGVWYYRRKRPPLAVPLATPAPSVAAAPATDVELRFEIPAGEPPVWGVGEPLVLTARNRGDPAAFDISWPGGSTKLRLAADADARTTLTFPQEGEVAISVTRADGHFAPSTASVRIVDYRKETAREFDLFLDKAQRIDASLTRRSTPREIAWTLAPRLDENAKSPLDELALVMEITNYSHYDVAREHYLRFVRASRALDAFLRAPDPASPGG